MYDFGCFTHPLQLCIHDAILKQKSAQELVTRRCEFGGHFKDLAVVVAKIPYIQDELCLSYNQLEVGCDHLLEFNPFIYCKACSRISKNPLYFLYKRDYCHCTDSCRVTTVIKLALFNGHKKRNF